MKDELYAIALLNAERYEALARRAEKASDEELADFFRAMRNESRKNAQKARELLAQRVAE